MDDDVDLEDIINSEEFEKALFLIEMGHFHCDVFELTKEIIRAKRKNNEYETREQKYLVWGR